MRGHLIVPLDEGRFAAAARWPQQGLWGSWQVATSQRVLRDGPLVEAHR
jgi:hypothetical protein